MGGGRSWFVHASASLRRRAILMEAGAAFVIGLPLASALELVDALCRP